MWEVVVAVADVVAGVAKSEIHFIYDRKQQQKHLKRTHAKKKSAGSRERYGLGEEERYEEKERQRGKGRSKVG